MPGRELEYQRTVNYMMQPDTVSSHRVIGVTEGQHALMVADDLEAWHAREDNVRYLGIEFCQPLLRDKYSDWQIEQGIAICVEWCRKYGIKPSTATIRRHSDTEQGKRDGKSDPGSPFPYADFMAKVALLL